MKKRNVKKLELAKETLQSLDLRDVPVQAGINFGSLDIRCTFGTIA